VTYTAEPHLVCFAASTPFVQQKLGLCRAHLGTFFEEEEAYRSRILCLLGDFLNDRSLELPESLGLFNPIGGSNVNIAAIGPDRSEIQVRVYERGSWGRTKACGTGATAVVAIAHGLGLLTGDGAKVLTEGSVFSPQGSPFAPSYAREIGALVIEKRENNWWMHGPVEHLYSGELDGWEQRLNGYVPLGEKSKSHKWRSPVQTPRRPEFSRLIG
jgi:hypothetical protein